MSRLSAADLEDSTDPTHEPSGFGSRKSYRPKTAHIRQREPCVSLIGRPCRAAIVGRNHHCAAAVSDTATRVTHVAQTEDGSRNWRRVGKSPCLTAIVRNR